MYKFSFCDILLFTKLDYAQTHRHTDEAKYIINRTAGG